MSYGYDEETDKWYPMTKVRHPKTGEWVMALMTKEYYEWVAKEVKRNMDDLTRKLQEQE